MKQNKTKIGDTAKLKEI